MAVILERGEFTRADTLETAVTLSFYVLGLAGYFAQQILTRAFYALQESSVPARTAVIAVGVSLVLNLILVWPLGSGGLAAATAVLLVCPGGDARRGSATTSRLGRARRRRPGLAGHRHWPRSAWPLAVGGVQYLLSESSRVLSLGVAVLAGALVYGVLAGVLRIEMLSLFLGKRRRAAI